MNDVSELFWNASVEQLKKGYVYDGTTEEFTCLVCGRSYEKGIVYADDNRLYEAEKFAERHIAQEHSSMFDYMVGLDKKFTGLTDLQKSLLAMFYAGLSDKEIVDELDGGSASTIRNHRFSLREKMKQAKIFLAIMEMAEEKTANKQKFIATHRTPTMFDQRYAITEQENETILKTYFKDGLHGPLSEFPKKQKRKIAILTHIMKKFQPDRQYTEKEVKSILKPIYDDDVTIRRYLIDYGFMDRLPDGSKYWVKTSGTEN